MRPVHLRRGFAAVVVLCALAVSTERAEAQTETNVMYACYVPLTGTVYRIRETNLKQSCTSTSHVEFSWNAQGPAGPPGSDGAPGQTGPQGPPGPAGAGGSGWEIVRPPNITVPTASFFDRTVECPAGKVPVSGGLNGVNQTTLVHNFFTLIERHSGPVIGTAGAPSGWRVVALNPEGSGPRLISIFAICVNP